MKTEAAHVANEYRLSTAKVSLRRKRGTLAAVSVWLLFMLATLLPQKLCAQQDPAFLHYWSLAPQYNPAAVGRNPQLCINGAYQAHASGFEDAGDVDTVPMSINSIN